MDTILKQSDRNIRSGHWFLGLLVIILLWLRAPVWLAFLATTYIILEDWLHLSEEARKDMEFRAFEKGLLSEIESPEKRKKVLGRPNTTPNEIFMYQKHIVEDYGNDVFRVLDVGGNDIGLQFGVISDAMREVEARGLTEEAKK